MRSICTAIFSPNRLRRFVYIILFYGCMYAPLDPIGQLLNRQLPSTNDQAQHIHNTSTNPSRIQPQLSVANSPLSSLKDTICIYQLSQRSPRSPYSSLPTRLLLARTSPRNRCHAASNISKRTAQRTKIVLACEIKTLGTVVRERVRMTSTEGGFVRLVRDVEWNLRRSSGVDKMGKNMEEID
ncbi:hypothetical protein K491DRAFT_383685 [Lophiostoma macrostomum CBS 122681]|uniref:Uncharacterized protein n=1 Tax=Lophiostoma macrostomum CBS 122681 TaxID=1314788 RepID=A0A6A6TPI4_9PLEO|nr:hypothetical protein K491DRAFT_383685 [Lophiostoma macrostomum CBS 122681]